MTPTRKRSAWYITMIVLLIVLVVVWLVFVLVVVWLVFVLVVVFLCWLWCGWYCCAGCGVAGIAVLVVVWLVLLCWLWLVLVTPCVFRKLFLKDVLIKNSNIFFYKISIIALLRLNK